jgi:hypothetical protein
MQTKQEKKIADLKIEIRDLESSKEIAHDKLT